MENRTGGWDAFQSLTARFSPAQNFDLMGHFPRKNSCGRQNSGPREAQTLIPGATKTSHQMAGAGLLRLQGELRPTASCLGMRDRLLHQLGGTVTAGSP